MGYDKEKLYKNAIEIAKNEKCLFIDHLVNLLPCSRQTFYDFFKVGSDKLDNIKEIINNNKANMKKAMYNKWFESDSAPLQIALMKLIATEEEAHRLNGTKQQHDHNIKQNNTIVESNRTSTIN